MIENKRIQIRRDIALNWTTKNPVLLYGEVGFDMTANNIKIGDGVTPWNSLEYISAKVDLSEYYTKEQVDDLIKRIDIPEVDLTQYYTKEETENKIEEAIQGIEIPEVDLTQYYTKEETETKIEEAVESIDIPETDLSDYYTKEETETLVTDKIDNKQWFGTQEEYDALEDKDPNTIYYVEGVQQEVDLSGYYTKGETETKIEEAIQGIDIPETETPGKGNIIIKQGDNTQVFNVNQAEDQTIYLGGGEGSEWFGSQAEFDALESYNEETVYHITDMEYKELKNKPFIPRKTSDLINNVDFTMRRDVKRIVTQREWYGTQEEFDAIENPDPDVIYHVEEVTEENVGDLIDRKLWFGTQEEFNALENKDENVVYYVEVENSVVADFSNYYTKAEVDALLAQIKG